MTDTVDITMQQSMEDNYVAYFNLGAGMPGYTCRQLSGGTFFVDSGWNDSFFNVIVKSDVTDPVLLQEAEVTLAHFAASKRPFRWKTTKKQRQLRGFLLANGLRLMEENYVFTSVAHAARSNNQGVSDLVCHQISNLEEQTLWWTPFQSAFNVCPTLRESICTFNRRAAEKQPGLFRNMAFTRGATPVCSATLYEHKEKYFLYDLGVHSEHQGRGIAKRAMMMLTRLIRSSGNKPLVFYSTPRGRNLYRNLGFQEHGSVELYNL